MNNKIYAKATAGVYAEVINQIYDSIDKRLREAVSNAYDAKANQVKISVFLTGDDCIRIIDNGYGMSETDLLEKYVTMGGGDNYNKQNTIGRIGIGALSVFALGDRIEINTRQKESDKVIIAELYFDRIKKASEHATPLENISLGEIIGKREANENDPEHFTEIIIKDLSKTARDIFNSEESTKELIEKLERILPIMHREDDPLFDSLLIHSELKQKFKSEKYYIEVTLHIPHLNYNNYKLYRRSIFSVEEANIKETYPIFPITLEGGKDKNLCIMGYLYINANRALPKSWQGINARVKNVTIEGNTFFGYEQDAAARVRIGGEIYIENIDENNAIQSNRSGFAVENNDYKIIAQYIKNPPIVTSIQKVRQNDRINSIVKRHVKHISLFRNMFKRISAIESEKENADSFKNLNDGKIGEIDRFTEFSLENHLANALEEINIEFEFNWAGVLEDGLYYIEPEDNDYYIIFVHTDLKEFVFDVAGNSVKYVLGHFTDGLPIIIKKPGVIYLNLDSDLLSNRDFNDIEVGYIEVILILYLNYLRNKDNAELLFKDAMRDLMFQ